MSSVAFLKASLGEGCPGDQGPLTAVLTSIDPCGETRVLAMSKGREGLPCVAQMVENMPAMQETWVQSLSQEDAWRTEWQPTPVFLPGEFHGQRNLVSYSP